MRSTLALLALSLTALLGCADCRCGRPCEPSLRPGCHLVMPPPAEAPPAPVPATANPNGPVLRAFDVADLVGRPRTMDQLVDAAKAHLPSDAIVAAQGTSHLIVKAQSDAQAALDAWLRSERTAAGLPPPPAGAAPTPAPAPVRPAYPFEAEAPRLVFYDVSDLVGTDPTAREALFAGVKPVVPAIASLEMKSSVLVARGTSGEQRAIAAWLAAKRREAAASK